VDSTPTEQKRYAFRACGEDVQIYPRAHVVSPEVVSVGDSVVVDDFVFLVGGMETRIGSFVHLASFSSYLGRGRLVIEDFVSVSSGARLYTGIDDFLGGSLVGPGVPSPYRQPKRSFLHVGRHALVGANAVVFPGVTLGEGCAIGALSLVNGDCEPWTIYGGVPAKPLKPRPRERVLELERQLRRDLFDGEGHYIPAARR
jgi:acetyltransferase-like isoleucine patch superfamily enzyme